MTDAAEPIDLRRRGDARLLVSRIAADLIWQNGITATRGDDIAAAAGIATRTLWRYFRSKEACIEPVLIESGRRFVTVLSGWPLELSIDDYLAASAPSGSVTYSPDDIRAMRMVALGFSEPALRSVWLMVCETAERESRAVFASRMGVPLDSPEARRIAASVAGAIRALNDALSTDYVEREVAPAATDVLAAVGQAIREASGGRVGEAVSR